MVTNNCLEKSAYHAGKDIITTKVPRSRDCNDNELTIIRVEKIFLCSQTKHSFAYCQNSLSNIILRVASACLEKLIIYVFLYLSKNVNVNNSNILI